MQNRPFESTDSNAQGSPVPGEPLFLAVGQLRRPHGIRGEMQMVVLTDFPERLVPGFTVFLGEKHHQHQIRSVRPHKGLLLVAFNGYEDRTAVEVLRNLYVYVPLESAPELPEGEYYQHELLGLVVRTEKGTVLGPVVEILETGANDVLVVQMAGDREALLPLIDEVVLDVDLETGVMQVRLLPGLIPGMDEG
jgi:16S rRNA processing protein RimM